jgi:fatty acyl-CoA reductase
LFECFLSTLYGAATADPANLKLTSILLVAIAVLVEKILRVQPDVKQIYLLIQPQGNATADQRLQTKVINSPLFQVLKAQCGGQDTFECFVKKKLTAVSGTISNDDLDMMLH